jgi:ABC-type sugar transport system ATPase subunit
VTVVGLVGDNGAGKSTLVDILSGALQPNGGTILVDGQAVTFGSSFEARRLGIETVYQDLSPAPDLSVWANIFLGRETK